MSGFPSIRQDTTMKAGNLLEQFLGAAGGGVAQPGDKPARGQGGSSMGGFTGGALAGGVLGLLLGNKKMRKMAGGVVSYGAAAGAGALAWQAYRNWQEGKDAASAPLPTPADAAQLDPRFQPDAATASDGEPFPLVLMRAMIAAARADGHIDADEQRRLFEQVDRLGLDAEGKAFVFDALNEPVSVSDLAASASGIEQASEIYLVSRLAIDPDHPAERAYLEALAHRLDLPGDLVAHLDHQVEAGTEPIQD